MYTHNCRWFQGGPYSQLLEESWLITLSVIFRSCFESRHLPRLYPNTVLKNWLTSTGSLPLPKLSSTPPYGCAWLVHPVWHCAGWHWVLSISAPLKNARSNINRIRRYRIKPLSCFFFYCKLTLELLNVFVKFAFRVICYNMVNGVDLLDWQFYFPSKNLPYVFSLSEKTLPLRPIPSSLSAIKKKVHSSHPNVNTSWAFVFPTADIRSEKSWSSVAMTLVVVLYCDTTYGTSFPVTCWSKSLSVNTVESFRLSIS